MIGEMVYKMPSIHLSFSHFANIFSRFRQFDDKCIAGFTGKHIKQKIKAPFAIWHISFLQPKYDEKLHKYGIEPLHKSLMLFRAVNINISASASAFRKS